jgi:muramoyltetrapeptide carboxypeptidase LdcA involved in peptidoglycan recycling
MKRYTSHVMEYSYPVAFNLPMGHKAPNFAFFHGALGTLLVNEKAVKLSFEIENATNSTS